MSYEYLVNQIEWNCEKSGLPSEVVIELPDWLVLADDSDLGRDVIEVDEVWDRAVKDAVEALVGVRPHNFGFEPVD